jgi:hypothetical protein
MAHVLLSPALPALAMNTSSTILCGLSTALLAAACSSAPTRGPGEEAPRTIPPDQAAALLPPVPVEAGGEPIDVGELTGYAGPAVLDHDGDGLPDLLVGSFSGRILVHRNVGSRREPVFAEGVFLQAAGEPLEISNW